MRNKLSEEHTILKRIHFIMQTNNAKKVYVAEAEGIPEYGTTTTLGKRLVAVKFVLPEASEKKK